MAELANTPSSNSLKENESTNSGPSNEIKKEGLAQLTSQSTDLSPPNQGVHAKDEDVGADASIDDEDKL